MPHGMNHGATSIAGRAVSFDKFSERRATPPPRLPSPAVTDSENGPRPVLSEAARQELHWIAGEGSPSLSRHARIILARHEGRSLSEIAHILDIDRATVRRWLVRFERHGLRGLVHASTGKTRK